MIWPAVLAGLLALAGCAAGSASAEPDPSPTPASRQASPRPTDDGPSRTPAAGGTDVVEGTFGADSVEGGCTYLASADGERYQVLYPEGWTDRASPLSLTNPDGEVVARGGETITVRGNHEGDMASICQIGPIFRAEEVVSIEE